LPKRACRHACSPTPSMEKRRRSRPDRFSTAGGLR
jgi:hypothetical protein